MKCSKCGKRISKKFKLCPNCGTKVEIKKENKRFNKKTIIIILSAILMFLISLFAFITIHSRSITVMRESVVKINVYDKEGNLIQTGSGFVAFKKNILITNAHVITGGYSAEAVNENDERVFIKGAIYYNQDEDITILKLNSANVLKPLKLSSSYNSGDKVIAIGSPLGIKNSVSDGIISNILENGTIQHTAPISPGSSGGVLFNSSGKVIGMNTATIDGGQNINLAISSKTIKNAYNKSKNNKAVSIKKVQYLNDNVKSVMLNNKAGKKLVELIDSLDNSENGVYYDDIRNYKKTYVKGYYLYKLADNGIATDWVNVRIDNQFDENLKLVESKLPFFQIIKVSDMSSDTISLVKGYLTEEAEANYQALLEDSTYSEIKTNCDFLNDDCGIDLSKDRVTAKLSNSYINAWASPVISHYNNYIYVIVSKDSNIIEKIEKLIKQLP